MFGFHPKAPATPRDYAACSGCSLCLLVCPAWRDSHDPRLTAEGLAKGLQAGASTAQVAGALEACSLCGACEPVCPERIDLVGLIVELRRSLPRRVELDAVRAGLAQGARTAANAVPMLPLLVKDSARYVEWCIEPDGEGRQIAYESNDGGDREIFNGLRDPGSKIDLSVPYGGAVKIRIFVNGILVEERPVK